MESPDGTSRPNWPRPQGLSWLGQLLILEQGTLQAQLGQRAQIVCQRLGFSPSTLQLKLTDCLLVGLIFELSICELRQSSIGMC